MIRGILRTVLPADIAAGAFYLRAGYDRAPTLFQAVVWRATKEDENDQHFALNFDPGEEHEIYMEPLDSYGPYVLMPEVSVRVDPPSMNGTRNTSNIRSGTFFVVGETPYVAVTLGRLGFNIVNLSSGTIEPQNFSGEAWVSFARWQLVVDENQEEVPIASFGEQPASV